MDFFNTITQSVSTEYKDRGSKFIAKAFPVASPEDFKKELSLIRKEHPKAGHHCFAYRIGTDGNNFRSTDDGEPSGTAGKPILGQIDSKELTDVGVVVTRYFGGTLLGVPGLINAYKTSASLALQLIPSVQKPVLINYSLQFDHTLINEVMIILKKYQCVVLSQENLLFYVMNVGIPQNRRDEIIYKLGNLRNVEITTIV